MDYLEEITENRLSIFTMAAGWTKDETLALIKVWGDANVQCQLNSSKKPGYIRTLLETPKSPLQSSSPTNQSSTLHFPA